MAIAFTNKTTGRRTAAGSTATTASITPAANAILLLFVQARNTTSTSPPEPTSVSGLSLTWHHVEHVAFDTVAPNESSIDVYWAVTGASPSSGAITITWPSNTSQAAWIVDQATGGDLDGPIQSDTGSGSNPATTTLAALRDSSSYYWAATGCNVGGSWAPEGTELADYALQNSLGQAVGQLGTSYRSNDTTTSSTYTGSGDEYGVISVEIGVSSYIKTGHAHAPLRAGGVRGSGGIVMTKAGHAHSAFRAGGYHMPAVKTGRIAGTFVARGGYLERDGGITPWLEGQIMNWLFTGAALTPPTAHYLALFTSAPDEVSGGIEVAGNGYARAPVSNAIGSWAEAAGGGYFDGFDDEFFGGEWTTYDDANIVRTEADGLCWFTYDGAGTGWSGIQNYEISGGLQGSELRARVDAGLQQNGWQVYLAFAYDADNQLVLQVENGVIHAYRKVGGAAYDDLATDTYDPDAMRYFQLRESAGTSFWETSADCVVWNELHSETNPITVTSGYIEVGAGAWQDVAPAVATFDDVWLSKETSKLLETCVGFPVATGSWGVVEAVGMYDAPTGGHLWTWRPITPLTIGSGELVVIEPNDLEVAMP